MYKVLQILIGIYWEWSILYLFPQFFCLLEVFFINYNISRSHSNFFYKLEIVVTEKFSSEEKKRLLEVVVAFCADVVVLQVLLSVESDHFGLHLPLLNINFVAYKHHWNVFAYSATCKVEFGKFLTLRGLCATLEYFCK